MTSLLIGGCPRGVAVLAVLALGLLWAPQEAASFSMYSASFFPQPVDTQYLYTFNLLGRFVTPGIGDPLMTGTASLGFTVTNYAPSRTPTQDYRLTVTVNVNRYANFSGALGSVLLHQGAVHYKGPLVLNMTAKWTYPRRTTTASATIVVANTTTIKCPQLRYATVSKAFEYLILYPGNNFLQITSKKLPGGSIRGQLVKVAGYPIVPTRR